MPRTQPLSVLTETIYDAAVDHAAWPRVMALLGDRFRCSAEALYFLDFDRHAVRTVHLGGISNSYLRCFSERYYTDDNPCARARSLHRVGVVRTNERYARHFNDQRVLWRSTYYNEWLRPQRLAPMIGVTLLDDADKNLNCTLLRSRDVPDFTAAEVAVFTRIGRHLRRALRIATRLESLSGRESLTFEALDCLGCGVVFVDLRGRLDHANAIAETLIQRGDGLTLIDGRLAAADGSSQRQLEFLLHDLARDPAGRSGAGPSRIAIARPNGLRPLVVSAIRLSTHRRAFLSPRPVILLLIVDPEAAPATDTDTETIRRLYRLTAAEARLALALLAGGSLREAADAAGMSYETARWYLKILYQKTETRRQAELVARLLRDLATPLNPNAGCSAISSRSH